MQASETIRQISGSNIMGAAGIGAVTYPAWIEFIYDPMFQFVLVILGAVMTISVVVVNVQSSIHKFIYGRKIEKEKQKQERIKTALLMREAKRKRVEV